MNTKDIIPLTSTTNNIPYLIKKSTPTGRAGIYLNKTCTTLKIIEEEFSEFLVWFFNSN